MKHNPYGLFDLEEIREANAFQNASAIHKNNSAFVPDTCWDYICRLKL